MKKSASAESFDLLGHNGRLASFLRTDQGCLTIPKAELKAAVAGAVSASVVKRNLGDKFAGQIFAIDSTVALYARN
jgi:hypothetical protein